MDYITILIEKNEFFPLFREGKIEQITYILTYRSQAEVQEVKDTVIRMNS